MVIETGSVVTLKKQHPCGGNVWTVVKTGADIKLQCNTCARYITITRDDLKKRAKGLEK